VEAYGLSGLTDTGGITQLEIGHTGTEPWLLAEVLVINTSSGARGRFIINKCVVVVLMLWLSLWSKSFEVSHRSASWT
jgi:hypothetical protein